MSSPLSVKDKIENERVVKIAPFRKHIRKTTPHKHNNYFEIVYLSQGAGFHFIDLSTHSIEPPVIFFIRQEQVHYWDIVSEPEGYVILIRKAFVERSLDNELKSLLGKVSVVNCLQLTDTFAIERILDLLAVESASDTVIISISPKGYLNHCWRKSSKHQSQSLSDRHTKVTFTFLSFNCLLLITG